MRHNDPVEQPSLEPIRFIAGRAKSAEGHWLGRRAWISCPLRIKLTSTWSTSIFILHKHSLINDSMPNLTLIYRLPWLITKRGPRGAQRFQEAALL